MMNTSRLPRMFRSVAQRVARPMSRDKTDVLLLLVACALVLLPHLGHLPLWIAPACAGLLAWRGWITFRGNRMPPRWLLLPIVVLAMAGVYVTYKTLLGREAGVAMLTLLLSLKLLEMHAKRDLFVVLFLSFFMILAGFFYSQSIGTALMTIVALTTLLTAQVSFQYTGVVPPFRQRLRTAATILALAAPLTLVLFLFFPRIQGPLWGLPNDANAGRSGLSDTMTPGNIASLALSDDVAFRVKFDNRVPSRNQLYWRGMVLGHYDGRIWTQQKTRFRADTPVVLKLHGASLHYQVTLEPHGRSWIFALDMPRALPSVSGNPISISHDMQLLASKPIHERIRYDAVSHVDFELQPNAPEPVLRQWLQLPAGFNSRTLELADRLREQVSNDVDRIDAVLRLFREQNFRYTLEPPTLGKHVVDEFLFDTRAGFCEHYAGAFVVLMRALGIPSRVVAGYQGGELNRTDGFMTVRQSDAHAWAEVWLKNRGWVRVDPTAAVAPERVEQNLSHIIPRRALGGFITLDPARHAWVAQWLKLRQNWEAVTNGWNQWVLNYTPDKQRNFVRSLGFSDGNWRTMIALMLVSALAAVAFVVLPLLFHRQKRDPIEVLYQSLCHAMARRGLPRAMHEGPRAYGERLAAADSSLAPEKKAALVQFLQLYEAQRYGVPTHTPAGAMSKLKFLLAECR